MVQKYAAKPFEEQNKSTFLHCLYRRSSFFAENTALLLQRPFFEWCVKNYFSL